MLTSRLCIESDSFQFRITLNDRPFTRGGVLSTLSSVYDPLGFIAPFILAGKQILHEMCRNQVDWDSPLPEHLLPRWRNWIDELKHLGSLQIRRCLKPEEFESLCRLSFITFLMPVPLDMASVPTYVLWMINNEFIVPLSWQRLELRQ